MNQAFRRIVSVTVLALALGAAGLHPTVLAPAAQAEARAEAATDRQHAVSEAALAELSRAFRAVAERIQPAVVSITTAGKMMAMTDEDGRPKLDDEILEWLRQHGIRPDDSGVFHLPSSAVGSGMIVDASGGLILTNNHVVEDAEQIYVRLDDGRRFPARTISTDSSSDMAVVRIEADGLKEVVFGDSDEVQVGDFVLAFGSPLRYAQTMTHGIVSAVGRNAPQLSVPYQNFIQTDAAINQGNSGGPLVNLRGEVVGMNTAIATQTGYDIGIGFAIPSSRITALLPRLKAGEAIVRGYLGIRMQDVHLWREEAMSLGWHEDRGVIVRGALPGTPAGNAGLGVDDIIFDIDGRPVRTSSELQDRIALTEPGTEVVLGILRERSKETVRLTVGRQPADFMELARAPLPDEDGQEEETLPDRPDSGAEPEPARLGVDIRELDQTLRRQYGWGASESGFVIVDVRPGSLAERGGLMPGDLIKAVAGKSAGSGEELRDEIAKGLAGDGVRLLIKSKQTGERELLFKVR